jgi:GAF domain-containing protein
MNMRFFSPAPRPDDEAVRQHAVRRSGVLAAEGDPALQDIVRRMAALFDAEAAAISIVDEDRQYFVANTGLAVRETSRAVSFCAHAILDPRQILYVPDAEHDLRFAGNPLVTGGPSIRFYVGAPLVTDDGQALGALCAIDSKPHEALSEQDQRELALLAQQAMRHIATLPG